MSPRDTRTSDIESFGHFSFAPVFIITDSYTVGNASGGQGDSFRENRPPGPPTKAFHWYGLDTGFFFASLCVPLWLRDLGAGKLINKTLSCIFNACNFFS
jgi:hypothetical protein